MRKVYVKVSAEFDINGDLSPTSFIWEDGEKYQIDRVYDHKNAVSLKAGGHGIRYRCRVMGKEVYLFFENGRWFMEGK